MIKLKSLNKKLLKLEVSLQKNAKKLAKLKRKVETALRVESARPKVTPPPQVEETSKPAKFAKAAKPPARRKRELTPAGREKLSALMKARWAAKRAGTASADEPLRAEA
jgi:hypothetical protein